MGLLKTEYKIEVWQDVWNGSYWDEFNIATVGASNMEHAGRAISPIFTQNINGEITLTFDLKSYFYNPETGGKEHNYLTNYLFNESKVKLYCPQYSTYEKDGTPINNGWYDFIVKEIEEKRGSEVSYSYKCQYLPINELSKTGQQLVFALDLANNVGTIDEITDKVLEGTSWELGELDADLTEGVEETVFSLQTTSNLYLSGLQTVVGKPVDIPSLPSGSTLYVSYTEIAKVNNPTVQVIYVPGGVDNLIFANGNIISNKLCYYTVPRSSIVNPNYLPTKYRGYKIVVTYKIAWNQELGYYTTEYKDSQNKKHYRYDVVNKNEDSVVLSASNNLITKVGHGYSNGDQIHFTSIKETTGISVNTMYYVVSSTADSFQISLTSGGSAIDFTNNGTGTLFKEIELVNVPHYFYYNSDVIVELDNNIDAALIASLTPVKSTNSEKVRALEIKESNRFNIIQKIAELFEVWTAFDIYHATNGKILLSPENKQIKKIRFLDEIGTKRWAGFTYGINLSGVSRKVISTELTTKMFVPRIDNDNLDTGSCSIAYVAENTSGQEYLYNLDYFVQVGLIDNTELIYDLYDIGNSTGIGLLSKLGLYNGYGYSDVIEKLKSEVVFSEEQLKTSEAALIVAQTQLTELVSEYDGGRATPNIIEKYNTSFPVLTALVASNTNKVAIAQTSVNSRKLALTTAQANERGVVGLKKDVEEAFYKKYSRYTQEGTWSGENYTNGSAYYYDAMNVLLDSSRPKIEYSIGVLDLSLLNEYENFIYNVGDVTYIEDVEFFGYTKPNQAGDSIPYREQVIVSILESNLDEPQSNKITVQNFKNQFDALFQRITATVQSYSLNENIYQRASNFTSKGELTFSALQSSLLNNSLILSQSSDESVIIDNTGISLTDLQDNTGMNRIRIVSGGIFVSSDGGNTWTTGITGEGINTNLLLAGQIDAAQINIIDGTYPCFTWDADGLTAFSYNTELFLQNKVEFVDSSDLVIKNNHGYLTSEEIKFSETIGTTGIGANQIYYVIKISDNSFKLASSQGNALSGVAIPFNGNGTGSIIVIDYQSFVRFDKDGLIGVDGDEEIFSVSWDGLFFKVKGTNENGALTSNIFIGNTEKTVEITDGVVKDCTLYVEKIVNGISTPTFAITTDGDAYFAGIVNALDFQINGVSVLTQDGLIDGQFISGINSNAVMKNLVVDQLSTSDKITNYLGSITADVNYIHIYDQFIEFITESTTNGSRQETSNGIAIGQSGAGLPLFWIAEDLENNIPLHTYITTEDNEEATLEHVMVYTYATRQVKSKYGFELNDGVYVPTLILGTGDQNGYSIGRIYKGTTGLYLEYTTSTNVKRKIALTDTGIDLSDFTEVTYANGSVISGGIIKTDRITLLENATLPGDRNLEVSCYMNTEVTLSNTAKDGIRVTIKNDTVQRKVLIHKGENLTDVIYPEEIFNYLSVGNGYWIGGFTNNDT